MRRGEENDEEEEVEKAEEGEKEGEEGSSAVQWSGVVVTVINGVGVWVENR